MTYDKDSFLAGLSVGMSLRYSKRIPAPVNCLTFYSQSPFTLSVANSTKNWDGTLEYSTDARNWSVWDGTTTLTASVVVGTYKIFVRGSGNSRFGYTAFVLDGERVSCDGNIETLLDYEQVSFGQHPTMAIACFNSLFENCTALISPPDLLATELSIFCYDSMFSGCSALERAPVLPATELKNSCYIRMFQNCASLRYPPALPSTSLASSCYMQMFEDCSSLIVAPELPATTLANYCYRSMFRGCAALKNAPSLPGTNSVTMPYADMFARCVNLETIPSVKFTVFKNNACVSMFHNCEKVKFSDSPVGEYVNAFRLPDVGTGTIDISAPYYAPFDHMFHGTGGTFTSDPTINTTYYTSNQIV